MGHNYIGHNYIGHNYMYAVNSHIWSESTPSCCCHREIVGVCVDRCEDRVVAVCEDRGYRHVRKERVQMCVQGMPAAQLPIAKS